VKYVPYYLLVLGIALFLARVASSGSDAEPAAVTTVVVTARLIPAAPLPTGAGLAPPPASAHTAPTRFDEAAFWRLVEETRRAGGNDTDKQVGLLDDRLRQLPKQDIIQFARIRRQLDQRAYTWNLWGAAYVIEDGCSDDCFRDFRAYLISLGRSAYEAALRNPDSLATVVQDEETGGWEDADDVAPDAYSSVTGEDFPLDDSDLSGAPRGTHFNERDAALAKRYPRLTARFR
jgi:hypothetical protein